MILSSFLLDLIGFIFITGFSEHCNLASRVDPGKCRKSVLSLYFELEHEKCSLLL